MNKENGKRALIISFVCAPAHRVTVLRTELPHFVRRFRLTATRALPSTRKGDASPLTPDFGLQ